MASSAKYFWDPRVHSPTKPADTEAGMVREESRVELKRVESPRSLADNDKPGPENTYRDGDRPPRRQTDEKRELSGVSKASEQARYDAEYKDKQRPQSLESARPSHSSSSTRHETTQQYTPKPEYGYPPSSTSRTHKEVYHDAPEVPQGYRRDGDGSTSHSHEHTKHSRSDPKTSTSDTAPSSQSSDLRKRYDALWRDYEYIHGELKLKNRSLEERDYWISSLKRDISALQRRYEDQSTVLTNVRQDLRSCQSQLDNVQRFISTADAHADQDIIQKLHELNEEVYNMSMTMADFVSEGFSRPSTTVPPETEERTPFGEVILATIGPVMASRLVTVEGADDMALFLQIAFQAYLSRLLCDIVSVWTLDPRLNPLVEETYQRLRKAETQAICGRWRSLTRAHILPTPASDPKMPVEYAMSALTEIVVAAGLFPSQVDAASKISPEFNEKITSIVSHAGRFAGMISDMISGDFEIFVVPPGTQFSKESMTDMTADERAPKGSKEPQAVLCVSRVGLRKQVAEKTMILTKAQVVLESFLC